MRITQGTFSFLPDLTDSEITAQIAYALEHGWPCSVEYTDDPHPRNTYWAMWGLPLFDLADPAAVLEEVTSTDDRIEAVAHHDAYAPLRHRRRVALEGRTLTVVDEITGNEVGEVQLGGDYRDEDGNLRSGDNPTHAGGVTVDGDNVYVTDNGTVFTYSLSDIRNGEAGGDPIDQSEAPQSVDGGSYTAFKDGRLYSGDFENDWLYVYERDENGKWARFQRKVPR